MKTITTEDHYEIKGKLYARVSRVVALSELSDFSKIPDADYYRSRGTANHDLWQKVEEGIDGDYTFDERVEKYRASHSLFLRQTGFRALPGGIEKLVYAPWSLFGIAAQHSRYAGVAGRIDRIGTIQDRVLFADYKTSTVTPSTRIQLALYLLMTPGYSFGSVERRGIAFRNDGTYSMSPKYPYTDKDEATRLVHRFFKEKS